MFPRKLIPGDEIRVITPSRSFGILSSTLREVATRNLSGQNFQVTFGKHCEEMDESNVPTFDRDLQSLIQQPGFEKVKGLVIGRFQKKTGMDPEKLVKIIQSKKELDPIPVVANADFGHTTPQFTFPIGGKGRLAAFNGGVSFTILEH